MADSLFSAEPSAPRRPGRWWRRRLVLYPLYIAYLLGLVWLGFKIFLRIQYGVSVVAPTAAVSLEDFYYPELRKTGALDVAATDDERLDVLLLGGSVLEQVGPELQRVLEARCSRPVEVYNVARSAHTSRDSLLKWRFLKGRRFDVVVIYHGINDIRMNCVAPGLFREDYTHCAWYAGFESRRAAGTVNLPAILTQTASRAAERIGLGEPEAADLAFGSEIRTPGPFRQNLAEIVAGVREQQGVVVLCSFASFLPENYTRDAFRSHELGYGSGVYELPVEAWGLPDNVSRTLDAHNRQIRELAVAGAGPDLRFLDLAREFPADGEHFSDVCHLTADGTRFWVQMVLPAIPDCFDGAGISGRGTSE